MILHVISSQYFSGLQKQHDQHHIKTFILATLVTSVAIFSIHKTYNNFGDAEKSNINIEEEDFNKKGTIKEHTRPEIISFPWEPTSSTDVIVKPIKRNSLPKNTTEHELDFLATMTFANGGVRAPTCTCCY